MSGVQLPQILAMLLVLCVILDIFNIIKRVRKGQLLYGIKNSLNAWRNFLGLLGGMYIILGGVSVLASIKEWAQQKSISAPPGIVEYIWLGIPIAWVIGVMILAILTIYKLPSIKYNEREKQWRKEEEEKLKAKYKLPKWLLWIVRN
jgi:hypothetical protein